jgi:3-phenylpropionate/cinnamic acid dioxygenase small subunit
MPAMEDQPDPVNFISHFYDDQVMMEIRRRNFVHPRASSKDSAVRCSHLIGNVRASLDEDGNTITATSNFHVVMWYREEQRGYAGRYEHTLVPGGDSFKIQRKKVDLINPEAPQRSMIIYL